MIEKHNLASNKLERLRSIVGLNAVVGSIALAAVLSQTHENLAAHTEVVVPAHPGVIEEAPSPDEIITVPEHSTIEPAPSP